MLSAEDNDLICRVGPGTPMGELMRRHWIPALNSRELTADGEPMRLMLLGEKLVAFRDTSGKVGIMDHECPHRLASLFYGRNEEGGLRCIYHGWKFDTEGNCLDMANVPPHQDFKAQVKAKAYKVVERAGIIWTYMGPGVAPELPAILATLLPPEEVSFSGFQRNCSYLTSLEGNIDTSHANFLHGGLNVNKTPIESPDDPRFYDPLKYGYTEAAYDYDVIETEWGMMYGAYRAVDGQRNYWRLAQFIFPFYVITPTSPIEELATLSAYVPLDDTHARRVSIGRKRMRRPDAGMIPERPTLPNTTDWYGRDRLKHNVGNDHLIDREMQRTVNYSGIVGVPQQDTAVQESMGAIPNRPKEHLAPSDRPIMVTRRIMIDAAKRLRDHGIVPPTATNPEIYADITGGYFLASKDKSLAEVYKEQQAIYLEANRALKQAAE